MKDEDQLEKALFHVKEKSYGPNYQEHVLEMYKLAVEMADRASHRRQVANSFYLSLNTALFAALGFLENDLQPTILFIVAGIFTSILWIRNIQTYKDLNSGKFKIINMLENKLPVMPYNAEWLFLKRENSSKSYRPFHKVEVLVPILFVAVYLMCFLLMLPWQRIAGFFCG